MFRIGDVDGDRAKLQRFANHLLGFALQGPPGLGLAAARRAGGVRVGPALVPRDPRTATWRSTARRCTRCC
ncbi:MAG: hypothetical protein U0802_08390 [Candidatus Binatia bacterium]